MDAMDKVDWETFDAWQGAGLRSMKFCFVASLPRCE